MRVVLAVFVLSLVTGEANGDAWTIQQLEDPMTGDRHVRASSPPTPPLVAPRFPYQDVESQINFHCDRHGREGVYFSFRSMNVPSNELATRVRWDDYRSTNSLRLDPNKLTNELWVIDDETEVTIRRLLHHDDLMLEVPFYGSGNAHFPFSLSGSSAAIAVARELCSGR